MLSTRFAQLRRLPLKSRPLVVMYSDGAGAIREAGGSFGKKEQAVEEQYFHKQQTELLQKLKKHCSNEIEAHEAEIKRHQEAISRLKKSHADMDKK